MSDARDNGGLDAWFKALLGSTTTVLAGFGMPRIALRLHHHLRYHVRGIDLSTLFTTNGTAWLPSKVVQKICFLGNTFSVDSLWHENDQKASVEKLCLRAWISAKVITSDACYTSMQTVRKVDTRHIRKDILLCLGTLLRQNDIIARANPRVTTNEYESFTLHKDGNMALHNSRFKTRVRVSNQSYVEVTSKDGTTHKGNAVKAHGRTTMVQFQKTLGDKLESVRVVGLDQPTTSEQARDAFLLRILQDQDKLLDSEFVRYIWFPNREDTALLDDRSALSLNSSLTTYVMHLNNSQRNVVAAMVSHDPIIVVHGPPGTGKTTTISSAAEIWSKVYSNPVWIIGHSNVSVKNIAEKLVKQKVDFKLIVSKEFYVEWHEHIYHEIEGRLIRTDELPQDSVGLSRVIGSSRVILSTLGLLSNPALDNNGTFKIVPFERVVVDEASQVRYLRSLHIFHKFRKSLVKLCFFGDPKQLPPFGQEKAKTLQSIFEVEHLKKTSYFLNVQYRMPVPLGSFISSHIYDGRLTSDHTIKQLSCIRFVDTPRGAEEKSGFSWINEGETKTIVDLVRNYYRNASFCIITPYDAQRAAIERALKAEGLPWENVFNVDSFQG
ncbi:P-loop containing nucleoside triphosphate hydrolase protein [Rhodocollybia butyracea]|uniref:P-loop containing nucleoside triphosphate hydrolase protein n=1 Tax=Rhodocollybia butyracea TaxID=206335 RepID=A0A9P5PIS2_9AGAR|nr:P-loop containing nucleoside triphosphate hydrolase protein [Rhodocollybia butyracea]